MKLAAVTTAKESTLEPRQGPSGSGQRPRHGGRRSMGPAFIIPLCLLLAAWALPGWAAPPDAPASGSPAKPEKPKKGPTALPPAEQLAYFAVAVAEDEKRDLKKLLENNPEFFTYRNAEGRTALFALADITDPEITQVILTYARELDAVDNTGKTALTVAVEKGNALAVEGLLGKGANPSLGDAQNRGPLTYAAFLGKLQVAQLLLRADADPKAVDRTGATPLHYAAAGGFHQLAQALIDHGADPNVKDRQGQTPLAIAERKKHTLVVRLLRRAGG